MTVDAYASASHYADHIASIWQHLPDDIRGTFYVRNIQDAPPGVTVTHSRPPNNNHPLLVSSYVDYRTCPRRPVIFVEHGAGQVYRQGHEGHSAYSGGRGRERVILFVCPSERVADNNRRAYPDTPAVAVGCPRLDKHYPLAPRQSSSPPTVAITFHADYSLIPEIRSGYRYFRTAIPLLQAAGYNVLGHGHPRLYHRIRNIYDQLQIQHTGDPDEVLRQASVLCVDNSSLGYEANALGVPTVWLTPPHYRRDVHHGLRYWSHIPGPTAESPTDVVAKVEEALDDRDYWPARREEIAEYVYKFRDGCSGARAAEAIAALYQDGATPAWDRPVDAKTGPS